MSIVERYIEVDYPVFQASDKVSGLLPLLDATAFKEAPVLQDGKLFAVVRSSDLAGIPENDLQQDLRLEQMTFGEPETVQEDEHVLDVFERLIAAGPGHILCVTDQDSCYKGVVDPADILRQIAKMFHFSEQGSTLEIEAPALGVKVSEIIGVIENNDAMVLSFGVVEPEPGAQAMVMTFRVQSSDFFRLVTNLEKYGYHIRYAVPSAQGGVDELREKALEFMRYIDM
ncbi:MAG: CBS domain-containing protein [Chlorobium phaeobacteroides]|uniref:Putative signal transduction protein with CBS domains n=1 Tax=Chlorobium phaeobacteroides (strain BS1) TaxID=331678 RepID=B3EJ53_CHLPB|nr:CBS domain-containing protein [Chlorobium phaeobacteroides]